MILEVLAGAALTYVCADERQKIIDNNWKLTDDELSEGIHMYFEKYPEDAEAFVSASQHDQDIMIATISNGIKESYEQKKPSWYHNLM